MPLTQVDQGLLGQYAQYTGFKNRIINGAMVIDQRNNGASVSFAGGNFPVDRMRLSVNSGGSATANAQQNLNSLTPPTGFVNYIGATVTNGTSMGASEAWRITQRIEGYSVADLGWGSAGAAPVTLSFWVRSNLTGTFGGSIFNNAGDRAYVFSYTISAANTWEYKTVTIAGDTSGTWLKTNGIGIVVSFSVGCGASVQGTAGVWGSTFLDSVTGQTNVMATNGNTFYITGVQLEKGSTATSFDYRPYGTELALCQRYLFAFVPGSSNYVPHLNGTICDAATAFFPITFPAQMRAAPSFTTTSGLRITNMVSGSTAVTSYDTAYMSASGGGLAAYTTPTSTYAGANSSTLLGANNGQARLLFSAEL